MFTKEEIQLLRLGVLSLEREDVRKGGSRDYYFEDQMTSLKNKLRELENGNEEQE